MPPLPAIVLACPGTMGLMLRALSDELPRTGYFDAWEALEHPDGYEPTEEVRQWMQENWNELMPKAAGNTPPDLSKDGQALSEVIPTTPTLTHAREVWEDWMPIFFTAFVTTGGNVTKAAKAAGKHRDTFYEHHDNNRLFYAAYLVAKEESDGFGRAKRDRPDHMAAKRWVVESPDGFRYSFPNLRSWCRSNEALFGAAQPSGKLPLWHQAASGITAIGNRTNVSQWKGWRLIHKGGILEPIPDISSPNRGVLPTRMPEPLASLNE